MHGIALPLSALRTEQSCGIGEYLDLIPLIDWCVDVGFDTIQLLPLQDSGSDPSPYSGISAMALHPIYLRLPGWPASNSPGPLNYHKILRQKLQWLREADLSHPLEEPWIDSYAAYKKEDPLSFHQKVQYLCDEQLRQVRAHADSRGIKLMGDLPLLLSPNSADVLAHPDLFDTSVAVGCPPDLYTTKGQYWGFPAYRWGAHRADNFSWWRQRLALAERYFHSYRIDHVVGFFHLWLIPRGKHPRDGSYSPHHFDEWMVQGTELMEMMLNASSMLPVGEDLGVVPTAVRQTLRRLGIYTTMFLPWERRLGSYIPGDEYPEKSLTTIGTHDAPTFAEWWKAYPTMSRNLAELLKLPWQPTFTHRAELLSYSHRTRSRLHINPIQEYLALCPDLIGKHERINIPGTHSRHNWTYRMQPTLEELHQREDLKRQIQEILKRSGRSY